MSVRHERFSSRWFWSFFSQFSRQVGFGASEHFCYRSAHGVVVRHALYSFDFGGTQMMARTGAPLALVVGAGLFVGSVIAACSNDAGPIAAGPSTSGTGTGGNSVVPNGGTMTGGTATGGVTAGGTATGGTGGATACGPNSLRHADDGMCHCQPASLTMCADGCGDLPTDPDHCGDCMTKCGPTQACAASKCSAAPMMVVPAAATCDGMHLAVSAGKLYWTDTMAGTLSSVATTGGAVTKLVEAQMKPTTIVVNGTSLYWLASDAKSVMTATTAGATPKAVVTSTTDEIGGFTLSADGMTLYWAAGVKVSKMPVAGGAAVEVGHEDSGIPHGLAVLDPYIGFPADINGDIDVMKIGAAPAVCASPDSVTAVNLNCGRLARSQGDLILDTIYIVGDNAYWANATEITTSSVSAPTGANTTIASVGLVNSAALKVSAFTVSGGKVYFADEPLDTDKEPTHSGYIYQAPLMEAAPITTMARGQKMPTSMVADDANLYWATSDCAIMSMPLK
jgi:hypothetical protein